MKKIQLILATLTLFSIVACSTQKDMSNTTASNVEEIVVDEVGVDEVKTHNVIVVINTADWCGLCKKNGPRVEQDIVSKYNGDNRYTIVVNDLSNEETKQASQKKLESVGLPNFSAENNGTGLIYFIHQESKEIQSKISVSKSTEKIIEAFEKAIIS